MNTSKRTFVLYSFSVVAVPAWAQLGLPGMGGNKSSGGGDPRKIEADLKRITELTSFALSALAEGMGMKEVAAKAKKTAEDIAAGKIGVPDATTTVSEIGPSVKAEMEKNQKEGKKLDADSAAAASKALLPAVEAFPLWKSVADGLKSLDRTALMGAASLAQAAPKVPTAAKSTMDMTQAGIAYLSFSGADVTAIEATAKSKLTF